MTYPIPQDDKGPQWPVSVKGVLIQNNKVVLLKNEREEWELPGGKLEPGESPETCVVREIEEELGFKTKIGPILDSWVYQITPQVQVLIITYVCTLFEPIKALTHSHEHKEVGLFDVAEVPSLHMPEGYKRSIQMCAKQ